MNSSVNSLHEFGSETPGSLWTPRKPTYSGDRCTNTPSVLHEDTRPTHGPTHVRNSVEGYQKTQRTIKLTGKSSHEPGSATRQRDATYAVVPQRYRDRHAPQRKLVLPPSQFPTRADLTTTPMTEVEELPPGGDRQSREGDYLSLVTHTS